MLLFSGSERHAPVLRRPARPKSAKRRPGLPQRPETEPDRQRLSHAAIKIRSVPRDGCIALYFWGLRMASPVAPPGLTRMFLHRRARKSSARKHSPVIMGGIKEVGAKAPGF